MRFDGDTFVSDRDGARLTAQLESVKALMLDQQPRTLAEIRAALHLPADARIDSRLRDLRKPKFGRYRVESKPGPNGVWKYQVLPPVPEGRLF